MKAKQSERCKNKVTCNMERGADVCDNCNMNVMVAGAGGIGCEILKNLLFVGVKRIWIVDMDIVEVSNLNRQDLYREADVGLPKVDAAARALKRYEEEKVGNKGANGLLIIPMKSRVEDIEIDIYNKMDFIFLALDNIEGRRFINSTVTSLVRWTGVGNKVTNPSSVPLDAQFNNPSPSSVIPMIEAASEGFNGQVRFIYIGLTPCYECTIWMTEGETNYALCSVKSVPVLPEHCIEFVRVVEWDQFKGEERFNIDEEDHLLWIYDRAVDRAKRFGLEDSSFSFEFVKEVLGAVIPGIPCTNAMVAGIAVQTFVKYLRQGLDEGSGLISGSDFAMIRGDSTIAIVPVKLVRDEFCPICACCMSIELVLPPEKTLIEVFGMIIGYGLISSEEDILDLYDGSVIYMANAALSMIYEPFLKMKVVDIFQFDWFYMIGSLKVYTKKSTNSKASIRFIHS